MDHTHEVGGSSPSAPTLVRCETGTSYVHLAMVASAVDAKSFWGTFPRIISEAPRTMARKRNSIPAYQRHSNGQARVRTYDANGMRVEILLPGDYDSAQSKEEYERVLAQLRVGSGRLPNAKPSSDLTMCELERTNRFRQPAQAVPLKQPAQAT
jgi:hypothetical protein